MYVPTLFVLGAAVLALPALALPAPRIPVPPYHLDDVDGFADLRDMFRSPVGHPRPFEPAALENYKANNKNNNDGDDDDYDDYSAYMLARKAAKDDNPFNHNWDKDIGAGRYRHPYEPDWPLSAGARPVRRLRLEGMHIVEVADKDIQEGETEGAVTSLTPTAAEDDDDNGDNDEDEDAKAITTATTTATNDEDDDDDEYDDEKSRRLTTTPHAIPPKLATRDAVHDFWHIAGWLSCLTGPCDHGKTDLEDAFDDRAASLDD